MGRRIITQKYAEKQNDLRDTIMAAVLSDEIIAKQAVIQVPPLTKADDFTMQLMKYIPAEIVAVYLFISGILHNLSPNIILNWCIFGFLLLLTPLYIWRVTNDPLLPPAWDQMIISFISFAIWVFAIGGPFAAFAWYNPLYGSILVALFTLIPPIVRKHA